MTPENVKLKGRQHKNLLRLYMSSSHTVQTGTNQIVNISFDNNEYGRIGDKFTFSSGRIRIGKDISKVRVKVNINLKPTKAGDYALLIGTNEIHYFHLTTDNYQNLSCETIRDVSEGDTLGITIRSVAMTNVDLTINSGICNSFIEVEEL